MAEELQGLWTAKGLEKLATHAAGGASLVIEQLALGDGGGSVPTPQASWTALTQEVWRGDINGVDTVDDDPSQVQVDVIIPFSTGGFFIREWGLYDEDGDLIAVGAHAEFYKPVLSSGAAAELTERILLPMANAGAITLSIPTQAMATQDYVQSQIGDHNENEEAHPDLLDGLDGLGDEIEVLDIIVGNHVADEDNPHNVTLEQLGGASSDHIHAALEAYRKSRIGTAHNMAGTALLSGYMWGDGTLVYFEDYPELEEAYNNGYLLVLGSDSTADEQAALPLYFVENSDGTGLYLPRLGGLFARAWTGTDDGTAGGYNAAGLPNVAGTFSFGNKSTTAPFEHGTTLNGQGDSGVGFSALYPGSMDLSRSNTIYGNSDTVMPESYNQPVAIYLGNLA